LYITQNSIIIRQDNNEVVIIWYTHNHFVAILDIVVMTTMGRTTYQPVALLESGLHKWQLNLTELGETGPKWSWCCESGMDNATTLERVQSGYRMPRPTALQGGVDCPVRMYEMMVKCWDKRPEQRPTFAYLREFFDDYATETEGQYQQQDWNCTGLRSRIDPLFTGLYSTDEPLWPIHVTSLCGWCIGFCSKIWCSVFCVCLTGMPTSLMIPQFCIVCFLFDAQIIDVSYSYSPVQYCKTVAFCFSFWLNIEECHCKAGTRRWSVVKILELISFLRVVFVVIFGLYSSVWLLKNGIWYR